jgi:hypothetical protein
MSNPLRVALGCLLCLPVWGAIATPIEAYPQFHLMLDSGTVGRYRQLEEQAEIEAQHLIEQAFAQSPTLTELSVMLLTERGGQVAPLLSVQVSRSDWQRYPDVNHWATYFRESAEFLGFRTPISETLPQRIPAISAPSVLDVSEPNFYN